jgi:hypothetical protein
VVEITGDDLERIGVEDREQLVVGQAQPLLELGGLQNSWFSSRRDGRRWRVPGSVEFAGGTATPDTLAVMAGGGLFGLVRQHAVSTRCRRSRAPARVSRVRPQSTELERLGGSTRGGRAIERGR